MTSPGNAEIHINGVYYGRSAADSEDYVSITLPGNVYNLRVEKPDGDEYIYLGERPGIAVVPGEEQLIRINLQKELTSYGRQRFENVAGERTLEQLRLENEQQELRAEELRLQMEVEEKRAANAAEAQRLESERRRQESEQRRREQEERRRAEQEERRRAEQERRQRAEQEQRRKAEEEERLRLEEESRIEEEERRRVEEEEEALRREEEERERAATEAERLRQQTFARRQAVHFSRFDVHRDGTITDRHTRLMWMRCPVGKRLVNNVCTGNAAEHDWTSSGVAVGDIRFAGYRDWRIPSFQELYSLVFCASGEYNLVSPDPGNPDEEQNLAGSELCLGDFELPAINLSAFPDAETDVVLTSTSSSTEPSRAWIVRFGKNLVDEVSKHTIGALVLVRAADSRIVANRYLAMEGGAVIKDLDTGLEWMRCAEGQMWNSDRNTCAGDSSSVSWEAAIEMNKTGGFRLPDVNELRSLVYCSNRRETGVARNYSSCGEPGSYRIPTLHPDVFPGSQPGRFWSSSPYGDESWYVNFSNGSVSHVRTSANNRVRLVRGNLGE